LSVAIHPAKLGGRQAGPLFEKPSEVFLITEAGLVGELSN
jgi:hypothetical protein